MSNYEQRYQTSSRESRAGRNSVRPNSRNSVRKRPDYHAGASAGRMHKKEKVVSTTRYDFMLLFVTIGIALFGVIMIYSAGYSTAALKGNPFQYVKTQIFCLILGIVAMLLLSVFDYQIIMQKLFHTKITLVHLLYVLALFLQSIVLVIGVDLNGAKRWLRFGPVQFQPSEISKVAAIVFIAYAIYQRRRDLDTWQGIVRIFVYMSPLILLIVKENLSSAIIVVGITFGMCFVASRKKSYFIVILLLGIAALGCIFLFGQGFRMSRIHVWRDIENANETGAYQIRQGLYAIASGGIFGKGLGRSMQKLFIPHGPRDYVHRIA